MEMRIHYLQHVPFENLANIEKWISQKNFPVTRTLLYANEALPPLNDFDWLFIMGGPMNIYEEKKYPWLVPEKEFIEQAIQAKKIVVGICLGAQLIADVLGARIYPNKSKEIGWYPVQLTHEASQSKIFSTFPAVFTAFHWHGDTFDLPEGSRWIAKSAVCNHQAFEYEERVIGLQFHQESSRESIAQLIRNCGDELVPAPYIQSKAELLADESRIQDINRLMFVFLNNVEKSSI